MLLLAFAETSIQLVPDGTLLFHLIIIVVMVALLNVSLLKPINRILEERERLTRGRLSEAQKLLAIIDEKLREYERRLRETRAEGYRVMEQERIGLSRERERRVAEVKAEIKRWTFEESAKLRMDAEQVRDQLKVDARARALEISRQILHRQTTGNQSPHNAQT